MSLPELGSDVIEKYNEIKELAEEKLDDPKNINIYLADDGDVHIIATHNEQEETPEKEWDTRYSWNEYKIVWKRSYPEIVYKEVESHNSRTVKKEVIE